jgi:hypothetical protein
MPGVSRHFLPIAFVKKYIDFLAKAAYSLTRVAQPNLVAHLIQQLHQLQGKGVRQQRAFL